MSARRAVSGGLSLLFVLLAGASANAQEVRLTGSSTLRYIGIRPLVLDSVPAAATVGDGVLRKTEDGRLVRCLDGAAACHYYRSGDGLGLVPALQDLTVSAWGLAPGLRGYAQIRARADLSGGAASWPRGDDALDVLEAYVELDRTRLRVRAGRQFKTSGLGYYNYDGLGVLLRHRGWLSVEGYAGWSLARGLNEPVSLEALAAVEPYAPGDRALLFGAELRLRPARGAAVTALYQREIRSDRATLYSERVTLDGTARWRAASLQGQLDADLGLRELNQAQLRLALPPVSHVTVDVFARRYRPYFELWTIWNAFTPVGFTEAGAGASWRPAGRGLLLAGRGAWRTYGETDAGLSFEPLRGEGWYADVSADMPLTPAWRLSGALAADLGFGSGRTQGTLRMERVVGEEGSAGLSLHAFQRSAELRVSEGTVYGASADYNLRIDARTRLSGALSAYRHVDRGEAPTVDWGQWRALLRLDWTLGPEPGVRRSPEDAP